MILTKISALCADDTKKYADDTRKYADDTRKYMDDTRTNCRRHITREFGPKSRKKNLGGGKWKKKNLWGEQR